MSDKEVEAWEEQMNRRTEELDRILEEANEYDPSLDPDLDGLGGLDD